MSENLELRVLSPHAPLGLPVLIVTFGQLSCEPGTVLSTSRV